MRWLRTVVVFDRGKVTTADGWDEIHTAYTEAIGRLAHPGGSDQFILRRKTRKLDGSGKPTSQWNRNGVTPIKLQFLSEMAKLGWRTEASARLDGTSLRAVLRTFPDGNPFVEELRSWPGDFDFASKTGDRLRVAIEWETGNISSSHRSLNKLCLAMLCKQIDVGVLIVPSRALYEHLTDRVGNWDELAPYLPYWNRVGTLAKRGLLAVSVVEHDQLTDDTRIPYLRSEKQGRSEEGAARIM